MLSCNTYKCLYISCVSFLSFSCAIFLHYSRCHHGTDLFAILCSLSLCAKAVAVQRDQNLCRVPMSPLPGRTWAIFCSVCWCPAGAMCSNTGSQPAGSTKPPRCSSTNATSPGIFGVRKIGWICGKSIDLYWNRVCCKLYFG